MLKGNHKKQLKIVPPCVISRATESKRWNEGDMKLKLSLKIVLLHRICFFPSTKFIALFERLAVLPWHRNMDDTRHKRKNAKNVVKSKGRQRERKMGTHFVGQNEFSASYLLPSRNTQLLFLHQHCNQSVLAFQSRSLEYTRAHSRQNDVSTFAAVSYLSSVQAYKSIKEHECSAVCQRVPIFSIYISCDLFETSQMRAKPFIPLKLVFRKFKLRIANAAVNVTISSCVWNMVLLLCSRRNISRISMKLMNNFQLRCAVSKYFGDLNCSVVYNLLL